MENLRFSNIVKNMILTTYGNRNQLNIFTHIFLNYYHKHRLSISQIITALNDL